MNELLILGQASESDISSLVQTISILAAVLIFVVKIVIEEWSKRKKGGAVRKSDLPVNCPGWERTQRLVEDLWRWHQPIQEPDTGQLRFTWYENENTELKSEMKMTRHELILHREETMKLRSSVERLEEKLVEVLEEKKK